MRRTHVSGAPLPFGYTLFPTSKRSEKEVGKENYQSTHLSGSRGTAQLVTLFWPDNHQYGARNDLRQLIHELRRSPDLLAAGDLLELVSEYHPKGEDMEAPKELLAGLKYDDCPEFNKWLTYQRQKLKLTFVLIHEREAQTLEERMQISQALAHAWVLLNADPFSGAAHRRVICLLPLKEDRSAALDAYHYCQKVMQLEFGIGPSLETVALAHEIEQGTAFFIDVQPQDNHPAPLELPVSTSNLSDHPIPLDKGAQPGLGRFKQKSGDVLLRPVAFLVKAGNAVLHTKLYIPEIRDTVVLRPRLLEKLNEGARNKLTLICAPAGFGKTTLVSGWVAHCGRQAAWLSLDTADNDPARFLTHFPLARLRAYGKLTELRAADLRFTRSGAAEFLKGVIGLDLAAEDIAVLEERTEGWIAGLQLAALSVQGRQDATKLVQRLS